MNCIRLRIVLPALATLAIAVLAPTKLAPRAAADEAGPFNPARVPANRWVKLSPGGDAPVSPRLGYEGACVWDPQQRVMIRYGGHNQGGGGEQGSEIWTFDPLTARWKLHETNTSPPGICCGQQNVFDPISGRYVRFPAFSGSHGWQWFREIYLNDASVWTYDLSENQWRNLRPVPTPNPRPLRCASWDSQHQVIVLFGGEGSSEGTRIYDPYTNTWTAPKPERQPKFRSGGNMAYDAARRRHILFGDQFDDDPHTWAYDIVRNEWTDLKPKEMPPTNANDAVLTYDPYNQVVLAIAKVTTGKDEDARHELQTWAFDTAANAWRRLNPPEEPSESGNRARQFMFVPEWGLALLENVTKSKPGPREQQVWVYRYAQPKHTESPSAPPAELSVATSANSATVRWKPGDAKQAHAWQIERGTGKQPWLVEFERIAEVEGDRIEYVDKGLPSGVIQYYRVRGVDQSGKPGPPGHIVRTQPPLVDGLVVSVLGPQEVRLAWKPQKRSDVAGYLVQRAPVEVYTDDQLRRLKKHTPPLEQPSVGAIRRIGQFQSLTEKPLAAGATQYNDKSVDLRTPVKVSGEPLYERRFHPEQYDESGRDYPLAVYAYRVLAVNALGVASGPSAATLTIPAAVEYVYSREEGETCHVKWQANREQDLRGYRVYRMDGRFSDAMIPRLTERPIDALEFSDPQAGNSTRRYYVVAVDALGQEGFPSAPVWFNREWQSFYKPFTGPWHQ